MGFFGKEVCSICEKEVGLNRTRIADGKYICPSCFKEAGFNKISNVTKPIKQMSIADVEKAIQAQNENKLELDSFNPTKKIGNFVEFDDNSKKWVLLTGIFGKRDKSTVYNYSDIVDFELLEDGESISSGGLGRALVGGAVFGGVGAIVGGVTGKKKTTGVCSSLKLKITLNNINHPVVYVNFIEAATKKDGLVYKNVYKLAHECLAVLEVICNQQQPVAEAPIQQNSSIADEILKYKNLLDMGAITQAEFDEKKSELLKI